ncbi:GMC family oxidoreductase [Mycolicibacterium palauense]|uniref:GMC family oxidoreductase n=1 Tax=Mycolicibacterium palauense TaxID=2034511 RepID=UPI000BFED3FA|nr:GMC family oxidoreductase N-terminal domain-containing protein [Mycolicibacterium palauense]
MRIDQSADYIVVGAGSAGALVATRLAAAGVDVILIEAGGTDRRPDVAVPAGVASLFTTANWKYPCAPDPSRGGARETFASGRIVGGSGSINAMVYVRGRRSDYDGWAADGCPGWGFDDVLPHFKAMESWVGGADEYRGGAGPITVSWCGHHHRIDDAFIEAAVEAGHRRNPDPNGRSQLGVARTQVNQRRGLRASSARAYLRGAPSGLRPRLLKRTTASRIVFDRGRAVGVECNGRVIRARREVILSAGAIGSPTLLLRSGIGPAGEVLDLPGVGENLQDHLVTEQSWTSRVPTINTLGPIGAAKAVGSMIGSGTGPLTTTPFEAQLFTEDYQIAVTPVHYSLDRVTGRARIRRADAFTVYTVLMHPATRGRVRLDRHRPVVELHRLGDAEDVRKLIEGSALARDLVQSQPAMRAVAGANLSGEVTGRSWLEQNEGSIYHAVGTCRMGGDGLAVVDPELRVHGVTGLRVVDASVIPALPSGNTNAPTMVIAHRAADLILRATV